MAGKEAQWIGTVYDLPNKIKSLVHGPMWRALPRAGRWIHYIDPKISGYTYNTIKTEIGICDTCQGETNKSRIDEQAVGVYVTSWRGELETGTLARVRNRRPLQVCCQRLVETCYLLVVVLLML